jgi:hypothetical protein
LLHACISSGIQTMNVYKCNGKNIFVRWKIEFSIPPDDNQVKFTTLMHEWKVLLHSNMQNWNFNCISRDRKNEY